MKRLICFALLMCSVFLFAGCSGGVPSENTISLDRKGKVTCTIVEDFDKDYYDAEELREIIEEDIAAYNVNFGQDRLILKKFETANGKAVLQTQFEEAKYYADYSGLTMFAGTVEEAREAGYDLLGECMGTDGSLTDLGSIEEADGLKVLILEEAAHVEVPGSIVCASRAGNVAINGKKEATVMEAEEAFIIYK